MHSYEILREAAERVGVKALAAELRLSPALVYKWCQECNRDDPDSSGARNPLDRLAEIVGLTHDTGVVRWLCHEADGFFVRNPRVSREEMDNALLQTTQLLIREFSDLLTTVSESIENDGEIDASEADRIRRVWEELKGTTECFVVACEQGLYRRDSRTVGDV